MVSVHEPREEPVRQGQLTIRARRNQDELVLALSGELDLASAPLLERKLENASAHRILVDLTGLDFMDSAGLHTLLRADPNRLAIRRGRPSVQRLFALTATEHLVRFED